MTDAILENLYYRRRSRRPVDLLLIDDTPLTWS
jgi:hypothetical protein